MTGLRVALAAQLSPELQRLVVEREPRIDLIGDTTLLAPMRFPADFTGDPGFRRTPEEDAALRDILEAADALFGVPDVSPALLARTVRANPRLRWVHTMAAGGGGLVKSADLTRDELDRVVFTTSAGVHGGPLAEFAVFGVLAGLKSLRRLLDQQERREWSDRWLMGQVAGAEVLVAGLGGIGSEVARQLTALGARVHGLSRHEHVDGVASVVHPRDLVHEAGRFDAVVTTLPGTEATERMFAADFFAAVRPGVVLVNVGRGTVIDEDALVTALDDGRVGYAALDVFAVEPLPQDSPLWGHPNVLVSPHTAALTDQEERRIAELFARNATALLDGTPQQNVVDTVEFY